MFRLWWAWRRMPILDWFRAHQSSGINHFLMIVSKPQSIFYCVSNSITTFVNLLLKTMLYKFAYKHLYLVKRIATVCSFRVKHTKWKSLVIFCLSTCLWLDSVITASRIRSSSRADSQTHPLTHVTLLPGVGKTCPYRLVIYQRRNNGWLNSDLPTVSVRWILRNLALDFTVVSTNCW